MILFHKLEWTGDAGFTARNKEWDARVKARRNLEAKNRTAKEPEPIPGYLQVQPYTEAHKINSFYHMVYGLRWEETK